jgi:hypothetical protein
MLPQQRRCRAHTSTLADPAQEPKRAREGTSVPNTRLVHERPRAWTEIEPGVRRVVLRRFPYALIYAIKPQEILVLAVAHHSREPGYWHGRGEIETPNR